MNETLKAIARRRSCRAYTDQVPTEDILAAVALAAVQSPSASNAQPWRVIVVTDKELLGEMERESTRVISQWEDKSMYNTVMARGTLYGGAPCVIMIPMRPGSGMDCGIVCQSVTIAASSLGLGSLICWQAGLALSGEKGDEFKRRLGFPEGFEFGMAVLLGYEKAPGKPHEPDMTKISYLK